MKNWHKRNSMFISLQSRGSSRYLFFFLLMLMTQVSVFAQRVENRGCPTSYFRNNGNGQSVTVFAQNIAPSSVYALNALTSGNQGNFTFKWDVPVVNPPVVTKTWVTSTGGVTAVNWTFGNNSSGSPFNPPGVPNVGDVKYTFYNSNLPTAGVITLELTDPYDGSYVNTCSYPLSSGSSSTGNIMSLAVQAPSNLNYAIAESSTLQGVAGNSVTPTVNAAGGSVTYNISPQVSGVSIDPQTGVISWSNTVAKGNYNLSVKASNGIQPDATANYTITVVESGVGSGSEGGLESKSLGNAVAEREYGAALSSKPSAVQYRTLPQLISVQAARTSGFGIRDLMPEQSALGIGFTGYITSPVDILSFTNAKEVVAVDYLQSGMNKAVAFCTKTFNGIYTHTKPVCDRLKGSELLAIDTIRSGNFSFLRYKLKPINGITEFAVSFSAGFGNATGNITLQSEWMTDNYASQDTMYNFQLWSADASILNTMLKNVIDKLTATMPVQQTGAVKKPVTYITKAERDINNQMNLKLTVQNSTASASATIVIEGKANEQTTAVTSFTYPVTLTANGVSTITVPVKDMAETEIRLKINGATEDFVYTNDGTWNVYKTPATVISSFIISNDTEQPKPNEYRLFRNIKIKATTSDYVTVYKMVKGGGMAANLTAYQTIKFNASGKGMMRIRLIKKSITNYSEQYEYLQPLTTELKEYNINTELFKSSANTAPVNMNDIVIVSFTYEAGATATVIDAALSNIRFAVKTSVPAVVAKQVKAYPNPASAQVSLLFESVQDETMQIVFIGTNGNIILRKQILVLKGFNNINMPLSSALARGMYTVQLISATQSMQTKIMVQ